MIIIVVQESVPVYVRKLVNVLKCVCRVCFGSEIQVALGHQTVEVGAKMRRSIDKTWKAVPSCS
jgi:hypothetical protein